MDNLINTSKGHIFGVNFRVDYGHNIWCKVNGPYYLSRNAKRFPWYFYHKNMWDNESPTSLICGACQPVNHISGPSLSGKTLFISSSSKLPRDLVRNSGYKITYSKDKADYIVIPKPEPRYNDFTISLLVRDADNNVYRCLSTNKMTSYHPPVEEFVKVLAKEINVDPDTLEYHYKDKELENLFQVWRVMDIQEYIDILSGDNTHHYILDCDLPLTPSNKLSVETLDLWSRLIKSDMNMFEKAVMNSDVRDYPLTFYAFMEFDEATLYHSKTQNLKWLMQNMGIYGGMPTGPFSVEDINLIESWVLYKLGAPENGGFVNYDKFNDLHYQYQNLLRRRMCVAPVKVTEPTTWLDLASKAKN